MAQQMWTSRHTGRTYETIAQFDARHLLVNVVGIITAGVIVVAARRVRGTPIETRARQVAGVVLGMMSLAYLAVTLRPSAVVYDETLPFHICDWLRIITPIAIGTGNEFAVTMSFFWGMWLNPMALLTPDAAWVTTRWVQEGAYWLFHWAALIVPLTLVFAFGYRPTWAGYRRATQTTLGWFAVTSVINAVTGGNYGFIARPTRGVSLISVLPRWPYYVPCLAGLILTGWAGVTWVAERFGADADAQASATLSAHGLVRRV
ncbi:YwaF family protein [Corynebacterium uterequi]|uniref:Putative integral membrane protein n=1 Tax=Corynebacterium uterequi TaxID=1072256 RepID=A0A0G3HHC5_9CORY|nr:TIGR02206 family membrane protein [Corynebacterium uterequi]AKK12155.1 putative integral membrane protein [Corynebacterium uterequi]